MELAKPHVERAAVQCAIRPLHDDDINGARERGRIDIFTDEMARISIRTFVELADGGEDLADKLHACV